jgi:hypothetical protein
VRDPARLALSAAVAALALTAVAVAAAPPAAPRPHVVWKPIPFGAARKAETAAYARRHYGLASWRLHPRVVVEHYTAGTTFASAFHTFAADVPDAELHELPGTCAHFVVDTDGRIYQLVPLNVVCRHTVGLNDSAIGIEHVGTSAAQILGNPAQLRSSLALTLWLMSRYRIGLADVIGHNESLSSRFHHERYPAWRCQTHGDWTSAEMAVYRTKLRALAAKERVAVGPPPRSKTTNCG